MREVTQVTIWSGRRHCVEPVIDGLLKLDYPADRLRRLWLVNGKIGPREMSTRILLPGTEALPEMPVYPQRQGYAPLIADRLERKRAIAQAWGAAIRRARACDTDLFFVEDDIEVPPRALLDLQATAMDMDAVMTSGLTFTDGAWPLFSFRSQAFTRWIDVPAEPFKVDATGTFCCYLRREF